jgi:predicted RNA-binding protein with PIN domain
MPIIIDGWNFIRNRGSDIDDTDGDALDSAKALMGRLGYFRRKHNDPIIVVFDSRCEHLDTGHENDAGLKAVATRDADAYIKKYVDGIAGPQRRNLRVVSSDNSVYYYAKSAHALPLRSEEFWDRINRA